MQRDESKLLKLLESPGRGATEKNDALSEILEYIYGCMEGNYYEYGYFRKISFLIFLDRILPKFQNSF